MAATALPWLAYFGARDALDDLIEVYFYHNIFSYSAQMTVGERFIGVGEAFSRMLYRTPWLFGALCIGVIGLLILRRLHQNWLGAVAPFVCALCLALGLYWGGRHFTYYFFIFAGFTSLAAVVVTYLIVTLGEKLLKLCVSMPNRRLMALSAALTLALTGLSYFVCENTYLLGTPKEQCVQYRFAEIIHQKKNATLLNYGFLDFGFYYAADILPVNRYFCLLNIEDERLPEMRAQQNQIVRERGVDFVVMAINPAQDVESLYLPDLFRNYEVAAQQVDICDNNNQVKYVLFQAKDIGRPS